MKLNKLALTLATLLTSGAAWSHGFVYDPPSRALLCNHISNFPEVNPGEKNQGCGNIQYEPQSLEADKGFPKAGTLIDGQLASANRTRGGELDAQSMDRWVKTQISAGKNVFKWNFTAPHPATKYEYFITKNNWNPNKPLTRDSFVTNPFCTVDGYGERPGAGKSVEHTCDVPDRQGYQVILAAWTVNDTSKAFYNVIDVDFAGHNNPGNDDTPPDDTTPPDDGGDEGHQKPVISLPQSRIELEQKTHSQAYKLDASATQNATHYKWEVISGFSNFQLQAEAQGTSHKMVQGENLKTPFVWVAANHTGKGTYRLTASNAYGSVTKDIQVEVKAKTPGGGDNGNGNVAAWDSRKTYKDRCTKVLRDGKVWQTQHWVDPGVDPLNSRETWGQPWQAVGSSFNNCK
jgi:predicted carbohydrate-binding protein with CBM5 and CBM33 domain